jgi:hypothetical protein
MGTANEASYLYRHSKELVQVNKKLRKLTKKAKKHTEKHQKANDSKTKQKHQKKHGKVSTEMKKLIEKHNHIIKKLRAHQIAFSHSLNKESVLKP